MTTETEDRTRLQADDEGGAVTESMPPESVPPPSDADAWSEITAVAVPQTGHGLASSSARLEPWCGPRRRLLPFG